MFHVLAIFTIFTNPTIINDYLNRILSICKSRNEKILYHIIKLNIKLFQQHQLLLTIHAI